MIIRWIVVALKAWTRLLDDKRGQIAVIFALSSSAIVVALGASVDLSRAYAARQKLSEVAELTCQYSVRPSVVAIANASYASTYGASGGFSTYVATVNTFASNALTAQHWSGPTPTAPSGTYFTATAAAATYTSQTGTAPTNPTVEISASVPTYFLRIVNINSVTVHAKIGCLSAASTPQITSATATPSNSSTNYYVMQEGFENTCAATCDINPYGGLTPLSTPTQTTPSAPMYTGNYGTKWYIIGYSSRSTRWARFRPRRPRARTRPSSTATTAAARRVIPRSRPRSISRRAITSCATRPSRASPIPIMPRPTSAGRPPRMCPGQTTR